MGYITDPWWREVLLLIYSYIQTVDDYPPAAQEYLDWLSTLEGEGITRLAGVELAGRAVLELHRPDSTVRHRQAERLVTTLSDPDLHVPGRQIAAAGDILSRLGDPRLEVISVRDLQFCAVPAGPFWMMVADEDTLENDNERSFHSARIPYDYWMSRFLVTNAQYQTFVDSSDGYSIDDWWTTDGLKWRGGRNAPDRGVGRTAPDEHGGVLYLPDHPVVMVRWYEAVAFTRWLTSLLHREEILPEGWVVHLPSEAEWEKAARGGLQIPVAPIIAKVKGLQVDYQSGLVMNLNSQRNYPWGDTPDSDKANVRETGVGTTSVVGSFAAGSSPYGILDMSGNVWEWCRTKWRRNFEEQADDNLEEDVPRVLRGGAFGLGLRAARCASRTWHGPLGIYANLGFRLVASSSTDLL